MTNLINNTNNNAYFLEKGWTTEDSTKTAVVGLKFIKSDSTADKANNVWGQVFFYDLIEQRYRNHLLIKQPEIKDTSEISCEDDVNEKYHFVYITKDLWDREVLPLLRFAPEIHSGLNKKVNTTEEVQAFLKRY